MKKISKILFVSLLVMIIVVTLTNTVFATKISDLNVTDKDNQTFNSFGNSVIKVLSAVGAITSVVVLIILGIKYMMGSLEEKAQYKKTFLPYVIGASLVFTASVIAEIIYNIAIEL